MDAEQRVRVRRKNGEETKGDRQHVLNGHAQLNGAEPVNAI